MSRAKSNVLIHRLCIAIRYGPESVQFSIFIYRIGNIRLALNKNQKDALHRKSKNFIIKEDVLSVMTGRKMLI